MSDTSKPTPGPWAISEYYNAHQNIHNARGIFAPGHTAPIVESVWGSTLAESDANAALIVAACNACQQVNPEHPQAVAEALPDLLRAAHDAAREWRLHGQLTDSCRHLEAALAKAEGRPTSDH